MGLFSSYRPGEDINSSETTSLSWTWPRSFIREISSCISPLSQTRREVSATRKKLRGSTISEQKNWQMHAPRSGVSSFSYLQRVFMEHKKNSLMKLALSQNLNRKALMLKVN